MQFMQQMGGTHDQTQEHGQTQQGGSTTDQTKGSMQQQQGQSAATPKQQSGAVQFSDWASI